MVKGIEQKRFLPTAKIFSFDGLSENVHPGVDGNIDKNPSLSNHASFQGQAINKKDPFTVRKTSDRRREIDRRVLVRRSFHKRRKNKIQNIQKEKRNNKDRRSSLDRRNAFNRRLLVERRINQLLTKSSNKKNAKKLFTSPKKALSKEIQNTLLRLNGVQEAMTFVQSGNHVTYLCCSLDTLGFSIKRASSFQLPIRVKDYVIRSFLS